MDKNTDPEPVSSSNSGKSITKKPFVQKAFGILIIFGIIALVGYLLYKSGVLNKIPVLKNFLPKG